MRQYRLLLLLPLFAVLFPHCPSPASCPFLPFPRTGARAPTRRSTRPGLTVCATSPPSAPRALCATSTGTPSQATAWRRSWTLRTPASTPRPVSGCFVSLDEETAWVVWLSWWCAVSPLGASAAWSSQCGVAFTLVPVAEPARPPPLSIPLDPQRRPTPAPTLPPPAAPTSSSRPCACWAR